MINNNNEEEEDGWPAFFSLKEAATVFKAHCGHVFESSQQPSEAGITSSFTDGERA